MTDAVFDRLADMIRSAAAGRKVIYIPNSGNYGDGLIRYATKAFFADYVIQHYEINVGFKGGRYHLLPFLLQHRKFFFVYGGGGAWCQAYDFGRTIVSFIDRFTSDYLVLPSTYELGLKNAKGVMVRRDQGRSREVAPKSIFCHDMAFYLAAKPRLIDAQRGVTGNLFRTDLESGRTAALPADNVDISMIGDHMSNGDDFLREVARYDTINTDRLHVAIAGALVGAKVTLYPGNYFKIRDIYHASMSHIFPDVVTFIDPS